MGQNAVKRRAEHVERGVVSDRGGRQRRELAQGPYCFDALGVHTYAFSPTDASHPATGQQRILNNQGAASNLTDTNSPDIPGILNGNASNSESTRSPAQCPASITPCYDTLTQLESDLNTHGLSTTPIWITEMGAVASCPKTLGCNSGEWLNDQQNAEMLLNFYDYLEGLPVATCASWSTANGVSGTPNGTPICKNANIDYVTCPDTTCGHVLLAMWFGDYVSTKIPDGNGGYIDNPNKDYSMLFNTNLQTKWVMKAFDSWPQQPG